MKSSKAPSEKLWTRAFFLIWQGQLVSTLGDAAYSVALGFWILQVTGSTALMGMLMAASTLPGVLVSPFAGVLIDRSDRKLIIICMDFIRGTGIMLVAAAAYSHHIAVWMVFAAGILLSLCGAAFRPGINSAIPDLVESSQLQSANSLMSIAATGSNMIGNVAGGFLFQLLGAPMLFLFNGLSYLFSGGCLCFAGIPKVHKKSKQDFFRDMIDGFQYMWLQKGLRYILLMAAVVNFFGFVAITDFLPFFQRTTYLGAGYYGVAMACFMGGSMAGFVVSSIVPFAARKRLLWFIGSNALSCFCLIAAINQTVFAVMVPLIIFGGFFNALVNVMLISVVQATTPTEMRGKVMAFMGMTTQGLTPFAMALGGVIAGFLSIRLTISACFFIIFVLFTPFYFVRSFGSFIGYKTGKQESDILT